MYDIVFSLLQLQSVLTFSILLVPSTKVVGRHYLI
jgi:hypothetical protein